MGWKQRKALTSFYRSVRVGDRVTSRYVGAGDFAALVARLDRGAAELRPAERAIVASERAKMFEWDRVPALACEAARMAVSVVLAESGIRRHRRGRWRRARDMSVTTMSTALSPTRRAEIEAWIGGLKSNDP